MGRNTVTILLFLVLGHSHSKFIQSAKNRIGKNGDEAGNKIKETITVPMWRSIADITTGWTPSSRSYVTDRTYKWPNAEIPYYFENSVSQFLRQKVQNYVNYFNQYTCVRWVKTRGHERNYVVFQEGPLPCWSQVGCVGGPQTINLNSACHMDTGHEMMHAMGFIHEHMRVDRDCYVAIRGDMLNSNYKNYGHYTYLPTDTRFPYDYNSVMQYPAYFGPNAIIWGRGSYYRGGSIGPNYDLYMSEHDLWKVKTLYCGYTHYCNVYPRDCQAYENYEKSCSAYG